MQLDSQARAAAGIALILALVAPGCGGSTVDETLGTNAEEAARKSHQRPIIRPDL